MKILNYRNYSKQIISLSALGLLSLIIWFFSPQLVINNNYPFQDSEKRFYLILFIWLVGLLKLYLFDYTHYKNQYAPTEEQVKKIQILHARFKGAIDFLKKTFLNNEGKKIQLFDLPWYLLIGPQNSGKTTLLANANVNYILAKQFKQEALKQLTPSDNYDWWVTRNLVLVDVPSTFVFEEKNNRFLWQSFLKLIKKSRKQNPIKGLVITLNLPELIKQEDAAQKTSVLISIRNSITQLKEQFNQAFPIYLIVTKCDLVSGFSEYFGDCSSDELSQLWGITIPPLRSDENIVEIFPQRFNALIKRLNKQLISRLHQERNQHSRPYIKDFPLQVERLKEALFNFIKALKLPDLNLQGVYLTSAIQPLNEEKNSQLSIIAHQSQNALQILNQPVHPARPFFIKQLINQGLLNTFEHTPLLNPKEKIFYRRLMYATAITIIAVSALLLGHDFQQGVQQAYSLQNLLSEYQIGLRQDGKEIDHLTKALPLLDALQSAAKKSTRHFSKLTNILTFYTTKSKKTAQQIYLAALQTIVIPEIKNYLEIYLKNNTDKNPVQSYAVLKAYLMIDGTVTLDTNFINNTLGQLLPDHFTKTQRDELSNHLQIALSELKPTPINADLVSKTRKSLLSQQKLQQAYIILKNMENYNVVSSINLGTNSDVLPALTTKGVADQIPNMFTARYFQPILSQAIPKAVSEALHGNSILGELGNKASESDELELTQELEKQYLNNYVDIWESLLANIQIINPNNLSQADSILTALTSDNSPLIQLLQTLQQNTTFGPILNSSPKLQALNSLLINTHSKGNTLYQIFVGLKELHQYLQPILKSENLGEAAFSAARARMMYDSPTADTFTQLNTLIQKSPEPIKNWLEKITSDSWRFILEETTHHIQARWKAMVMPYYSPIENDFPFKPSAREEVSLQQFTHFFKPQGVLSNFHQNFLKPFIKDSGKEWEWRKINNQQLPLSKALLQQMQYALELQRAIFSNNDDKLFIPFTLQPLSLDKSLTHVNLNINGQQISYQKSDPRTGRLLTWPGNNNARGITLNFTTENNFALNDSIKGNWAWFRLVNRSAQHVISRKELSLTFTVNNHSVKYLLITQGHLNPFIAINWERMQLPNELI